MHSIRPTRGRVAQAGGWLAAALAFGLATPGLARAQADPCAGTSPALGGELTTVRVTYLLSSPIFVTSPPGDSRRLLVVERDGRIQLLKDGVKLSTPFLDIEPLVLSQGDGGGREEGLLGLAFHPDYDANGWFFVYHTDTNGDNVVARYSRDATYPDLADPGTRQQVIFFPHPVRNNHNGGMLAFGPQDGYLYIGTGDGGGGCDPYDNALDGGSLLGKLLRLDVDSLPYAIPLDNPFVGDAAVLDEVWALGLRNPWRFSFDRGNGDLYTGDVGQNEWEEIDYAPGTSPGGENYGWDAYEGSHCPNPSCGTSNCSSVADHTSPLYEYAHTIGCSVTGGYVYRGCRIPDLHGTYFFADYCYDTIYSFRVVDGAVTEFTDRTAELDPPGMTIANISSFGEDSRGEIYVVDLAGEVFKIVPILSNLEVSGQRAQPLMLGQPDWIWEDLQASSGHPLSAYRVYRSDEVGVVPFDCVFEGPTPFWPGGDPDSPGAGAVWSYLVTAVNAAGEETSPGTASGSSRELSAAVCPQ
jgi:glucose/arabinose dehydrogenase